MAKGRNPVSRIVINWKQPRALAYGDRFTLSPGNNFVELSSWEKAKESLIIKHHLAQKHLVEGEMLPTKDGTKGLSPEKALAIIGKVNNLTLLADIGKLDTRKPIVDACAARIASVKEAALRQSETAEAGGEDEIEVDPDDSKE